MDGADATLRCVVYVGASMDGYIARSDDGLDFLDGPGGTSDLAPVDVGIVEAPDDTGYADLVAEVDGVVMGRTSYDVVRGLVDEWPYELPVVVLTSRPLDPPPDADVRALAGTPHEVAATLPEK